MRIGHASSGNDIPGDQTGKEVVIRGYFSKPWSYVIRAKDLADAEKMAQACEKGCNNACIGYSQARRNTLKAQAVIANYDLSKIKMDCDCDCSSFMTVCAECAGIKIPYSGSNAPNTATMLDAFLSTGRFEVLRDQRYLNTSNYLRRGDILVRLGSHTAMALDNGKAVDTIYPSLRRGMKNAYVSSWQIFLSQLGYYKGSIDGIFGGQTEEAVKQYQKAVGLPATGIIQLRDWLSVGKE